METSKIVCPNCSYTAMDDWQICPNCKHPLHNPTATIVEMPDWTGEEVVALLLQSLGVNLSDPNFKDTPKRVAKWLQDKFPNKELVKAQLDELVTKVFPSSYDEMVVQTGIRVYGLCPHHLKDIIYDIAIGYLPNGYIIGLSKLPRAAKLILGQAGTQEDLTMQFAAQLQRLLQVDNVAVIAKAQHGCMMCRGVMQDAVTITSSMNGLFKHDENGTKSEFMRLVRMGENN